MRVTIDAPDGVTIPGFFEELVAPAVRALVSRHPLQGMTDRTIHARFSVDGIGCWLVSVANGTEVSVLPDAATPAHITLRFDESAFRRSQTGTARRINMLQLLHGDRQRFDRLARLRGTLHVRLDDGGERRQLAMIFNEADEPAVSLRVGYDDFCDILDKNTNVAVLLMKRRLQVRGDMSLLLRAKALL